jgi:UDP-N-acetyl-D-mannosaminuronic acid dehydrogenase
MTTSIIGLGYIGLPTALLLASKHVPVIGIDVNPDVVDSVNNGKLHIVEPELDVLIEPAVSEGWLRASTQAEAADVFVIAVPTPFKDNYQPDLRFIQAAIDNIAPVLKTGDLVILESTSPVGTTETMARWLSELRSDLCFPSHELDDAADIAIAYCPERVLPGHVVKELVSNDRIIGGITPHCSAKAKEFYQLFVKGECHISNARTAELAKLTENSFRDVNIAFANELSLIANKLNINVWELISLANRHPRVNILQPGPGVGGHCIAVDPWFIVDSAPEEARLIRTAREVNDSKPSFVLGQISQAAQNTPEQYSIALLGLAFKPDIDDLRESPALQIALQVSNLMAFKACYVVEPHISKLPANFATSTTLTDLDTALEKADIVVLLVNHQQFYHPAPDKIANKTIIDTRGIWS